MSVVDLDEATPGPASPSDTVVTYTATIAERDPRRWQKRRANRNRLLAAVPPIVLLVVWELAARRDAIDVRFFPAPSTIAEDGQELIASGDLLAHTVATMSRVAYGYVPGALAGVVFGLLLGTLGILGAMFRPSVTAAYTVPKLGVFPLLLLIFGIGDAPKVILVAGTVFLLVTIATFDAVNSVPGGIRDVGKAFRANYFRRLTEIYLPAAMPQIFTSLRLSMGLSILLIIATEFVSGNDGIGYLIWNSWNLFRPAPMYVGIMTSAVLGVIATGLVGVVERIAMPWTRSTRVRV